MSELDALIGETVSEIRFGSGVRIVFEEGERVEPTLYLDVGRYTILDASGAVRDQDEARPDELGPTLSLVGKKVAGTSTEGAVLELTFADGSRLRCEPSRDFEAWQVVGAAPWALVYSSTDQEVDAFPM